MVFLNIYKCANNAYFLQIWSQMLLNFMCAISSKFYVPIYTCMHTYIHTYILLRMYAYTVDYVHSRIMAIISQVHKCKFDTINVGVFMYTIHTVLCSTSSHALLILLQVLLILLY